MKNIPFPLLLDKNSRKSDFVVRDLDLWSIEDLKILLKMVKDEIKSRKETRPFWV